MSTTLIDLTRATFIGLRWLLETSVVRWSFGMFFIGLVVHYVATLLHK